MQRLKEIQEEFKRLSTEVSQLKNSIDELQAAIPGVQKFINDVERDVKKWKFKTEPRLDRRLFLMCSKLIQMKRRSKK